MLNCRQYFPRVTQLKLFNESKTCGDYLPDSLQFLMPLKQIMNLQIHTYDLTIKQLVHLLHAMPNIAKLTVDLSYAKTEKDYAEIKQSEIFQNVEKMNKISQLSIIARYQLDYTNVIINLCPQIQYLNLTNDHSDAIEIIRCVVSNRHSIFSKLVMLCTHIHHRRTQHTLKTLVTTEDIFQNCSDKIIEDKFYLYF